MAKMYWTRCKYCKADIVFLKAKNGVMPVNKDSLSIQDKQSLLMDIPVPFDAIQHRKHFETCTKQTEQRSYNFVRY